MPTFSSHASRSESLHLFGLPSILGFGKGQEKKDGIREGVLQKYNVLREILYLDKTSLVIKISSGACEVLFMFSLLVALSWKMPQPASTVHGRRHVAAFPVHDFNGDF